MDGLAKKMPLTFGCLTVASLSLMGIPLFAGFISKWNIAEAAFACGSLALAGGSRMGILPYLGTAVILYSALMTGVYMLTVLVRAYFPKAAAAAAVKEEPYTDPNWMMMVPLLIFAAAVLVFGLYSGPLMELLTAIGGEAG